VEVVELRWFAVLAELEHVTRAAEVVGITQPALSKAMGRLEREVGVPLFDRRGRSVRLNRLGRFFRDGVVRALAELDTTHRHLADLIGVESGSVPVGFLPTLGTWLLPELVRGFRARHPGVRFELHQDRADRLLPALRAGTVDLILTSQRPSDPGVGWRRLLVEALHLVVPAGHPLGRGRRSVPLVAAAYEPFVMLRSGLGLRELSDELCRQAGFVPRVAFEGEEVETVRGLVGAGLGVALLPEVHPIPGADAPARTTTTRRQDRRRAAAPAAGGSGPATVDLFVSSPRCRRDIGLAWNLDRYRSPAVDEFRDEILKAHLTRRAAAAKR
jgi:LysR family transcriptional activator of glutamate synthase operon